jgi:rhamnosyltransferase
MKNPSASIIIRTLNEARYLQHLLEAIKAQHSDYTHEIIIVDSGSQDDTLAIAQDYRCRILHIEKKDFSFGRSLNIGCDAALGNYLVIISGHCVPCHGKWLQNLVSPLEQGVVEYSYGRQIGGKETNWAEHMIFEKYFPAYSQIPQHGYYCNNANSALLVKEWKRFSFNESLTGLEDIELAKRMTKEGKRIGYVAEASVFHYHHESFHQVRTRFEREAIALRSISPEISLRRRDAMRYLTQGIAEDIRAFKHKFNRIDIYIARQTIGYRLNQYLGALRGYKMHKEISAKMREGYYYPVQSNNLKPLQTKLLTSNEISMETTQASPRIIALLPMKRHSARVPNKNFRDFNGKPLFAWILDTLLSVDEISLVIINTDACDILKQHGLQDNDRILLRNRPSHLCGDFVSMNKIIEDDLNNSDADIYLMTHTTNPLLSASTIKKAIAIFLSKRNLGACDSLFTANRIQTRYYKKDGQPINHDPNNLVRTQDLEPWFEENSNLYVFSKDSFKASKARIGLKPEIFVNPKIETIDIDEPDDWNIALSLATLLDTSINHETSTK